MLMSKSDYVGKRPRMNPKVSKTLHQNIIGVASNGTRTAHEIRDTYNYNATVRNIQELIHSALNLDHKKMISGPSLTISHKEGRVK